MPKEAGAESGASIVKATIMSFLIPPVGWVMLLKGGHTPQQRKRVLVPSLVWTVAILIASPFLPEHEHAVAKHTPQLEAESTTQAAPKSTGSVNDFRFLVPPNVEGFVLVRADPFPVQVPGGPEPTGVQAIYLASDGSRRQAEVALFQSPEPIDDGAGARKVQVGDHGGVQHVDKLAVYTSWRNGPWFASTGVSAKTKKQKASARKSGLALANAVALWSDAGIAGLSPKQLQERIAAVDATLRSQESVTAAKKQVLDRFADNLPEWGDRVSLDPRNPNEIVVTVVPAWHLLPKAARQEQAKLVWRRWAQLNSPGNADRSSLKLVSAAGRRVGGSGLMGSSISVN